METYDQGGVQIEIVALATMQQSIPNVFLGRATLPNLWGAKHTFRGALPPLDPTSSATGSGRLGYVIGREIGKGGRRG